jgi:hypothetical protein
VVRAVLPSQLWLRGILETLNYLGEYHDGLVTTTELDERMRLAAKSTRRALAQLSLLCLRVLRDHPLKAHDGLVVPIQIDQGIALVNQRLGDPDTRQ